MSTFDPVRSLLIDIPLPAVAAGGPFGFIAEWVTDIVERVGYPGIAFLVALENVFPPIPSELILPLGGFLAGQGRLSLVGVVIAATIGSIVGALILYFIGAWFGQARIEKLIVRYGRYASLSVEDLAKSEAWFQRFGHWAVLIGRMMPLVRSLISLPAGLHRMPLGTFVLYSAIGSAMWNIVLIGAGWLLGDNWEQVGDVVGYLQYVVVAAIIAGVAYFFLRRWRARQQPAA